MDPNRHIDIMGVVNLTDDSYFAPSRCLVAGDEDATVQNVVERVARLIAEGATIIDLGACSTRPGALPVGEEEEWRRLEPVLKALHLRFPDTLLSIDTWWSSVVRRAHDLIGNFIVNDISAGEDDPMMLPLVGELGLRYIAMHKRGTSADMQQLTDYKHLTEDVVSYFMSFAAKALENKIDDWILDPGFGFAKDIGQNYLLLKELRTFKEIVLPGGRQPVILVGVSRKSMIHRLFDITPEDALPATQVLHLAALQNGADILRVHDVSEAVRTLTLYRKLA